MKLRLRSGEVTRLRDMANNAEWGVYDIARIDGQGAVPVWAAQARLNIAPLLQMSCGAFEDLQHLP